MVDINKNYWLAIAPHVYCCIKEEQALLYNTKNGEYLEIQDSTIIALLRQLHKKQNLGTTLCSGAMLTQPCFREFLHSFLSKDMGYLWNIIDMPKKPIQMMPILNLQNDIDKLQKTDERDMGEEALLYLSELNIYLNNTCKHHCNYCSKIAKQKLCCNIKENESCQALEFSALEHILSQIKYAAVGKLNLLGGNLFQYPYYEELSSYTDQFKGKIHLWNHYADFAGIVKLNTNFIYNVVALFPLIKEQFLSSLHTLKKLQSRIHFYVTKLEEYKEAEELIDKYEINDYLIHPLYIETNIDFFEKFVYMSKEDILQQNTSFKQIFIHQKMNSHFFGTLTILVNGNVCVNLNTPVLGNIHNDALIDIVNKEMIVNTAWRKIRENQPCTECLFQYLCPSPSNYEYVIGRENLCHVRQ